MAIQIKKSYMGGFPILHLIGESDENSMSELGLAVRKHFPVGGAHYYLDVSELRFVDSIFIGFLVSLHISIHEVGESLVFLNPSKEMSEIFSMTNIDQILKIEWTHNTKEN